VAKTTFFRKRDAEKVGPVSDKSASQNDPTTERERSIGRTAIDNRAIARDFYTPRFFFAREKAMGTTILLDKYGKSYPNWNNYQFRHKEWGKIYDDQVEMGIEMTRYERMEREHDARQPFVEQDLIEALQANVCRSYRQLSKHINSWCATREIWLKSHKSYHIYTKNIKPGLSVENRAKQVAFSAHVHNRWGLDPSIKKVLWVMCDEKWFHGLVPRANAKACEELGILKQTYSAHHKKHIAKSNPPLYHAYCTSNNLLSIIHPHVGNPEDGGDGYLIGAHRCAAFKVPQKDVYHASKDPVTGKTVYKGNAIKRPKDIPFLVDCNVKGFDAGSTNVPCFPLKTLLWEHSLIPAIKAMTAHDGACAGAQVILQEDNAGPHTEARYTALMMETFAELGWKIELQAPQGKSLIALFVVL
jgi:hypothetical protein